ncbi:MAG TPA: hypothetical protein VNX02_06160 [Steroidobacteraceae bacterium]|nr:hypothetical protein [Steroidobacteraceae bacterium]
MIRIQGRAVVYGEVWFDEPPPQPPLDVDVLVYRYHPRPLANSRATELHSLRTDLAAAPAIIMGAFDETCRRHIRRAERQDGLRHEIFDAGALDEFVAFYDVFALQKGLWLADRHWLGRAAAARQLALTCVSQDGERLVWHAHLRAGHTAQLAHSASLYRSLSPERRSLVGRANRWLHWRDMLDFKAAGACCYDWGGMFEDESTPERAGINHFKRTFGGTPVLAYECTVPVTLRGRVWLRLREVLRRGPRQRPAAQAA